MIPDDQTDRVFISDRLEARFPAVAEGLRRILADHGVAVERIAGTKDIWCRDYMPVQTGAETFVWFRYDPRYLRGRKDEITTPADIFTIPLLKKCQSSEIVLDGGNVIGWEDRCIMTERVYPENRGIKRAELREKLRNLLGVETLTLVPSEPEEEFGHADGIVRFIDRGTVLVNDYSANDAPYGDELTSTLQGAGLDCVKLPYGPDEGLPGKVQSAFGVYVNFLRVRGLVVMPSFGIDRDEEALRVVKERVPGSEVTSLDCRELSRAGGVLNCVTWSVLDERTKR